jgi:hypothetical protein
MNKEANLTPTGSDSMEGDAFALVRRVLEDHQSGMGGCLCGNAPDVFYRRELHDHVARVIVDTLASAPTPAPAYEGLSQAAARLGVNLIWDATVKGIPSGVSYVTAWGETGEWRTDPALTIADVERIRSVFPSAPVTIHAGYGN